MTKRVTWVWVATLLVVACGGTDDANEDGGGPDAGPCPLVCDDDLFCNGVEVCDPSHPSADESGCVRGAAPCADACAEATRECITGCPDRDGDGHAGAPCGTDCDDDDPAVQPGTLEICDPAGVDEDCDPATFGFRDADRDTYADAACCNGENCGTDCDDMSGGVHPGLAETCDARDNDCDGLVDEGVVPTWYVDGDGDGFGDASPDAETRMVCLRPDSGWADNNDDCDDARADVNPGLPEVCNDLDDNCRGGIDEGISCACSITAPSRSCGTNEGICVSGVQSCGGGVWGPCDGEVAPGIERCDPLRPGAAGLDEDCDGTTDEGLTIDGCYVDGDNDTWGEASAGRLCAVAGGGCPAGTVSRGGDCGPPSMAINPGATETCNGSDDDCDGGSDERLHTAFAPFSRTAVPCEVWEYGRDLECEGRIATACGSHSAPPACPFNSGFFIEVGGVVQSVCLSPQHLQPVARWELEARHSGCNGTSGEYNACQAAAHRYCRSGISATPFETGYTYRISGGYFVACFGSAESQVVSASWSDLDALDGAAEPYCNGTRDGWWCARAANRFCRERAPGGPFVAGFGPVEYSSGGASVACIRPF